MRGNLQLKKLILCGVTGLLILPQLLLATGTYEYGEKIPSNSAYNVKLNAFNSSQQDKQLYTNTQEFLYTTSFGEDMAYQLSTENTEVDYYPTGTKYNANYLAGGVTLIPGYSAYSLNNPKSLFFEVYPGTSNAVQKTARISFKAWTTETTLSGGATTYNNGIDPRTVMVKIYRGEDVYTFTAEPHSSNSIRLVPQGIYVNSKGEDLFYVMTPYYYDGEGVAYEIGFNDELELGEKIEVYITGDYTKDYQNAATKQAATYFSFKVAGVPFLEKIVADHTERLNPASDSNSVKKFDSALYGWSMAGGGDVNGDGFNDMVVSDPYFLYSESNIGSAQQRSGVVYIYLGGPQHDDVADVVLENRIDYVDSDGASPYARREFGYHVELGDINGDGYADVIVGQPSYGNENTTGAGAINSGRIVIYFGGPSLIDGSSSLDSRKPSLIIENNSGTGGTDAPDLFGEKFAVGDLNGDGYSDILAKAGTLAYVLDGSKLYAKLPDPSIKKYPVTISDLSAVAASGSSGGFKTGLDANSALAIIGDVNNDTYKDFAITFPSLQAGSSIVEVYLGGNSWSSILSGSKSVLKDTSSFSQYFGFSVAGAGDINNDGYDDIVVGNKTISTLNGHYGRVIVFLGMASMPTLYQYGGSAGNITAFMISDPFKDNEAYNEASEFGMTVTGVGDIDGDSYDDFMIGAPDFGKSDTGAAYIFLGSPYSIGNFTPDQLESYIIIGDYANAHVGRTIVNVGDIDADGYDDPAVASLGYILGSQVGAYNSADFTGYGEKVIQNVTHNISVYANLNAVDQAPPVLLSSYPYDCSVGWNPDGTMEFVLADRGNGGLEFDTLLIAFRRKGLAESKNTYILKPRTAFSVDYGNSYQSQLVNFTAVDFWVTQEYFDNNGNRQLNKEYIYNSSKTLTQMWKDAGYEAVKVLEGGYPAYSYDKKARILGLKIKPNATFINNGSLDYSEDYVIDVKIRDRAGSSFELYGGTLNASVISFSTRQEKYGTVGTANYVFQSKDAQGPSLNQFIDIGNFNGDSDGLHDFAYANPEYNNGKGAVFIYWGSPAIDFSKAPDLIITPENYYTGTTSYLTCHFGKFLTSLNTDAADTPPELVIGFDNAYYDNATKGFIPYSHGGFYVFVGDTNGTKYVNISDYAIDGETILYPEEHSDICQRVNMYGTTRPTIAEAIHTKSGKNELLAVAGQNKTVCVYRNNAGSYMLLSTPNATAILPAFSTEITDLAAGYFDGGDVQQLAIGLPYYTESGKEYGQVKIYSISSANGVISLAEKDTISNTSEGARCGFALAAGYFDDSFDANDDGIYDFTNNNYSHDMYEDLAVGYPFDSVFAPRAGKVVIFKGSSEGLLADPSVSANIYVIKPESAYDHFGYALGSAKYLSTPTHYKNWGITTTTTYFDDADDLLVGAPGYNIDLTDQASEVTASIEPAHHDSEGKMYIYIGNSEFDDVADAGIVGTTSGNCLGKTVGAAGDLLNNCADLIMAGGQNDNVPILINRSIPDTTPPYVEAILPSPRSYDVSQTANISIEVSDISGIRRDKLNIYRIIEGTPNYLVQAGVISNRSDLNWDDFTISEDIIKSDGSRKKYTLSMLGTYKSPYYPDKKKGEWAESETVELLFTVGDDRYVWTGSGKNAVRIENPLTRKISSGFVVKFAANEITPVEFKGSEVYNSYFASSMTSVGDVNGDGYTDFIVGEYGNNQNGFYAGKVYLYLGCAKSTAENVAEFVKPDAEITLGLTGSYSQSSARLGWRVAPAGDMNGDGYDDVAIVAANSGISGAEVFILFGNPDPRSATAIARDGAYADRKLDPLGNVSSLEWNNVYLERYAVCIQAAAPKDHLGDGIAGGGDINGDGYDDLILGAPLYADGATDTGRVYVIWGRSDMLAIDTRMNYNEASREDTVHGPIKLSTDLSVLGNNGLIPDNKYGFYIRNTTRNDRFGGVILSNINLNGDIVTITRNVFGMVVTENIELSEVLISSLGYSSGRGKVSIYTYSKDGTNKYFAKNTDNDNLLMGAYAGDMFGFSLANLGDITADTNLGNNSTALTGDDFAVGAPGSDGDDPEDNPQYDIGSVYVFSSTPANIYDFQLTANMFTYGQNQGDMFGYTVANVGNIDNDQYNTNDLAVAAPFFKVGSKANVGRVYIFATPLKNFGTDTAPSYKQIMDSFADYVAEGNNSGDMFGASICGIGDLDGDYVSEYIIGAPCVASTTNMADSDYQGNIGRAFLYANPDETCPKVEDPMSYLNPIPGDKAAILVDTVLKAGVRQAVYNPLKFSLSDDRALSIGSVMVEVEPVGKKDTRKYIFVPSKTGEYSYTIKNRKWADFILNLKNNVYYETTYNVRIYATDTSSNPLKYEYVGVSGFLYSSQGISGFGNTPAARVPEYISDPTVEAVTDLPSSIVKNYFQYSFVTTANPFGAPNIELLIDHAVDSSAVNYIHDTTAQFKLQLKDKHGLSDFTVIVSPNVLGNRSDNTFVFGATTKNAELLTAHPVSFNTISPIQQMVDVFDFPSGKVDGMFNVFVTATDNALPVHNVATRNFVFFKDTLPPVITPVAPLAGQKNALYNDSITFNVTDDGTGVDIMNDYFNFDLSKIKIIANSSLGSITPNFRITKNEDIDIEVSYNYSSVPEGYANYIPKLTFAIKGLELKYEEIVTLAITVTDNAGHVANYTYSYQVSPDYKAPVPGVTPLTIYESPFTSGNLTVSVDASDDVIVKKVMFTIVEDSGYSGLINLNNPATATRNLYIDLGSAATKNFTGKFNLLISGINGNTLVDGTQTVKVYFFDAQGNRSTPGSATIILDANSKNGGPIMPTVILSLPTNTEVPLYQNMPRYINSPTINLYLYAWDPQVNPPTSPITAQVKGFVLEMGPAGNKPYYNETNSKLNRLFAFSPEVYDSKTKRTYHKIEGFNLVNLQEGENIITVNFLDYDAPLTDNVEATCFPDDDLNTYYISASNPLTGSSGRTGEDSSSHPINNVSLDKYLYPQSNTVNHWVQTEKLMPLTFYYDITPPVLSGLFIKGGSSDIFPSKVFTRDATKIIVQLVYNDYQYSNVTDNKKYLNPVNDLYYQIIVVSSNKTTTSNVSYLYADVQGTNTLKVMGTTGNWMLSGTLKDQAGNPIKKGSKYLIYSLNGYDTLYGTLTDEDYEKVMGDENGGGLKDLYPSYSFEKERLTTADITYIKSLSDSAYNVYDTSYTQAMKALKAAAINNNTYIGNYVSLIVSNNGSTYFADVARMSKNDYEYKKILAIRDVGTSLLTTADIGEAKVYLDISADVGDTTAQKAIFKKILAEIRQASANAVLDDLTTTNFKATATANWNHIDLSDNPYGSAAGLTAQIAPDTLVLPVTLTANVRYYLRVVVKDKAGNYSKIITSNCIGLDLPKTGYYPETPVSLYATGIKLSRNVFDIDFSDKQSGVSYVGFKTDPAASTYYSLSDSSFLNNNIKENSALSHMVTYNGFAYEEFYTTINGKWRMPTAVWNNLPEGTAINLYFKVKDGVNNTWEKSNTSILEFYKDTTKPSVTISFPNAISYGGKNYSKTATNNLKYSISGDSILVITDQVIDSILTENYTGKMPLLLADKDFSFEEQGDASMVTPSTSPSYWKFNKPTDTFYKAKIACLESKADGGISDKHYHGIYGMVLDFEVTQGEDSGTDRYYQWQGISTTFNIPADATTAVATTYSIGLMMDSTLTTANMGSGLIGTGTNQGGFGLKVQAGTKTAYSTVRLNKAVGDGGQTWKMITVNIVVPAHPTQEQIVTVSVLHLINKTNKSVTIDRSGDGNPSNGILPLGPGFNGRILVDSLIVVPGNAVIDNAQGNILVNTSQAGQNNFYYYAYDDAGNAATGNVSVIVDTTAPTWNAVASANFLHRATSMLANVSVKTKDGVDYVNAIQNNIAYLSAKFLPAENESYITRYEYALMRIPYSGDVQTVNIEEVLPSNADDSAATYRPLLIDKKFNVSRGSTYYFRARARNIIQEWSDYKDSNKLTIDVDAPTLSYEIEPSIVATANQAGKTVSWNTGWYTDDIAVTIQAKDVMWITTENAVAGGAGVRYIYVVTNNNSFATRYAVSNLPSDQVIITLNLTEEGSNRFKAWAEDEYGYTSSYYIVTNNLYIDRKAPQVQTNLDLSLTNIPVVDQTKWLNSAKKFTVSFSDGVGDGTYRVYWKIDGEDMPFFTLDTSKIGNPIPSVANIDTVDVTLNEGVWYGTFLKTDLADTSITQAEIDKLVQNNILEKSTNTNSVIQYSWKKGFNELDLIYTLQKLGITHVADFVTVWRYKSNGATTYYQTIESNSFKIYNDGYHRVDLYAIDKFGHQSEVVTQQYVCMDQGRPDVLIDMGGSFQSVWSLENITLNMQVFDMFKDPVLVTSSYFVAGTPIPAALDNLEVRRPGSGVKKIGINLNSKGWLYFEPEPDDQVNNIQKVDRFGFTINRGNEYIGNDYPVSEFIITQNGVNMFAYQVFDFAGNASEVTYWQFDSAKPDGGRVWDDALNTYFYPGDTSVIRGVKVDTLPPYSGKATISSDSFTDLSSAKLYTNKPEITVAFGAKDDGIGVKYGILTCEQNSGASTSALGLTANVVNDPATYLTVQRWVTINTIAPFLTKASRHPVNKDQGIIDYTNTRKVIFGELQGTRNFTMVYSDDFGFPYTQAAAAVEQTSTTFNYTDYEAGSVKAVDLVPLQTQQANKYFVVNNGTDSYFAWEGRFMVPTQNYGSGDRHSEEGSGYVAYASLSNGAFSEDDYTHYSYKDRTISGTTKVRIYFWNELMPQRVDHRGATVNSQTIVYDNIINTSKYPIVIDEMGQAVINKVTTNFVSTQHINLKFRHDDTNELSGIYGIKITGAVATENGYVTPNTWLSYARGITNNYKVSIKSPVQDGFVTVSVGAIRDRANNVIENITTANHVLRFYYDRAMPSTNLDPTSQTGRIRLYNNNTNSSDKGKNINGNTFASCKDFKLEMDMFGANEYEVTELLKSGLEHTLVSGNYAALADVDSDTKMVTFSFSAANVYDSEKTLYVKFYDRGWTGSKLTSPVSSYKVITFNMIVDSTSPTVNVVGLDKSKFYSDTVQFSLVADERSAGAEVIAGIKTVEWQINNAAIQTKAFNSIGVKLATINIVITETSTANRVRYRVTDYVSNTYGWQEISGIKLNANPPNLYLVMDAENSSGMYIKKTTPNIAIGALGTTYISLHGDTTATTRSYNANKTITVGGSTKLVDIWTFNFTSGDGEKNVTIDARDKYSNDGGPHDAKRYTFYLDSHKPVTPSITSITVATLNYIPSSFYLTGEKDDPEDEITGYASGCDVKFYVGNTSIQTTSLDDTHWRVRVIDVIKAMIPNYKYGISYYAVDKAKNSSGAKTINFILNKSYATGGEINGLNELAISGIQKTDQRIAKADEELTGVHVVPGLDSTILEYTATDVSNNEIHDFTSSGDVKLVIQYPQESANKGSVENFRIYYLNESTGLWEIVPGEQKVDKEKRTVEATINHFSIYRILQAVGYASNLKDVHVYPNPYMPNDDELGNGDDSNALYNHVIFENITPTSKVRIYTISGELVNTIDEKTNQAIYWYVDNNRGQRVASGVYIYIITDDDGNKKIGRVTVVR